MISKPCSREGLHIKDVAQHITTNAGQSDNNESLEPYSHMRVVLVFQGNSHENDKKYTETEVKQICAKQILLHSLKGKSSHYTSPFPKFRHCSYIISHRAKKVKKKKNTPLAGIASVAKKSQFCKFWLSFL
jgi:hypothetical protein